MKAYPEAREFREHSKIDAVGLCEFMANRGIEDPTFSRRMLLRAVVSGTVRPEDGQRTDVGSCDLRKEDELRFLQCQPNIHTELCCYNRGLWDGKGGVATWRAKEMLTRTAVTITFP
jgi:hypothetical protein